jgi:hypothetical protein
MKSFRLFRNQQPKLRAGILRVILSDRNFGFCKKHTKSHPKFRLSGNRRNFRSFVRKLITVQHSRSLDDDGRNMRYTVIIFLARNERIRAVKFRPKNFGRISFDLGEISPIQQILRLSIGRNSP